MEALILAIILKHASPEAVDAKPLVNEILTVAEEYSLDPVLLTQIIMTESRGDAAAENKVTHDFGLMQINHTTAALYGFSWECLTDWKCNLRAGAIILSKSKRVCQYNVGTAALNGDRLGKCLQYEARLANIK